MKTIVISLCAVVFLLSGCTIKDDNAHVAGDPEQAEAFVIQFYTLLKKKEYKSTYGLFGSFFYRKSDTAKLQQAYDSTTMLLGDIIDLKMIQNAIEIRGGTENFTEYRMIYKVKRTKYDSEESICLHKKDNKMEIMYYFVESESFRMEQSRKAIERTTLIKQ